MKLVSLADRIVFSSIKNFEYGQINLKNYDGKEYKLGNENSPLKANLIINKPGVTLNILNKGSIGLAESYMRGEFETDNLTNLIEITAKNIKKVHKFSGVLDLPLINFFKYFFIFCICEFRCRRVSGEICTKWVQNRRFDLSTPLNRGKFSRPIA